MMFALTSNMALTGNGKEKKKNHTEVFVFVCVCLINMAKLNKKFHGRGMWLSGTILALYTCGLKFYFQYPAP